MAKRIWQGVEPGFYAGLAGLQRGLAYEVSDETYKACPDFWGDEVTERKAENLEAKKEKEVTE